MGTMSEHIWVGQLGNAFIVLSLIAALFSGIGYYFYSKEVLTSE